MITTSTTMSVTGLNTRLESLEDAVEGLRSLAEGVLGASATVTHDYRSDGALYMNRMEAAAKEIGAALTCIHQARNTLCPVNRLPPELLGKIFAQMVADHLGTLLRTGWQIYEHERYVLSIRLTCRLWNTVVLSTPAVWSSISVDHTMSLGPLSTKLRRSGILPLHLLLDQPTQNHLSCLTSQLHRLQGLCVQCDIDYLMEPFFQQPVPTLQMLDLQIVEPKILIHTDLHTAMMPQLFDGQMPQLSRLHLTGSYPWLCKFGPNLTYLRIDNSLTTLQTSTTAFLDFLESCPKLVELILHIAGPCAEVDMHSSPRSVSLPELTNLRLHNVPCDTGACALRHLHLPAVSTICLTDIIGLTSADDLVYIADANSLNICNSLADPRSLSLWVIDNMFTIACGDDTSDEASQVRLHFSTDTETYDDQHQEDPDPFAPNLVLPKEEIIHALPQMLVVSNVTTLHLFRLHPLDSKDILLHLIDAMPSVERFAFFLSEIQAERDYWHSCLSCKNVTTFPCLRTLHILEGFRPHREWKPTWIFALALSRAKHGHRLGTLRSTMVGVPPDQSSQHTKWNSLAHRFQGKKVKGFVNEVLFDTDPDDPTELLEPAPLFDCE